MSTKPLNSLQQAIWLDTKQQCNPDINTANVLPLPAEFTGWGMPAGLLLPSG
jgi:hypothetical protein